MKVGFQIDNANWFECEFEEAVYKSLQTSYMDMGNKVLWIFVRQNAYNAIMLLRQH